MTDPFYSVEVRMEREQIEVTRDGTLPPFKPDYALAFIVADLRKGKR